MNNTHGNFDTIFLFGFVKYSVWKLHVARNIAQIMLFPYTEELLDLLNEDKCKNSKYSMQMKTNISHTVQVTKNTVI